MKRVFWILLTPLVGFLILWSVAVNYLAPALENWALKKIHSVSQTSLPFVIQAEKLHIALFKPSLSIDNIDLIPKAEIADVLKGLHIKNIFIYIDFFDLLGGRLTLSAVVIDSPELSLNMDPLLKSEAPPQELPIDLLFSQAEKIPLKRILLQNLKLNLKSEELKLSLDATNGDILLNNANKSLNAKTAFPAVKIKFNEGGAFQGAFDSHLLLNRQSLRVIQLGVHLEDSEIMARGELTNISKLMIKPTGLLKASAKINLSSASEELKAIFTDIKLPSVAGEIKLDMDTRFNGLQSLQGKANIKTTGLKIDKFELGDASLLGEYKNNTISLSEMKFSHPAGEAILTETRWTIKEPYSFDSKIKISNLDMQKLFQSMDLIEIPVGMQIRGELPCEGKVKPQFELNCNNVDLIASQLWVKSGSAKDASQILDLEEMRAKGQVQINTKEVSYKARVNIGPSAGASDGVIDFDKGFKINFKSENLDFAHIKNLANLKFKGTAHLEGSTSGDSDAAIFDMNLMARDFVFENFSLGNLATEMKYRKGHLSLENIAGGIGKSQYLGQVDINLNEEKLSGDLSAPTIDLHDLAFVFNNIYKLPLEIHGFGALKAHFDGPMDLWKMNYELDSSFKKLSLGYENFDLLNFKISALKGEIKTNNILLQRGLSTLILNGKVGSDQEMNLTAEGKNWRLEESDILSSNKANSAIMGNLNFTAELTETLKNPFIRIKGGVSETLFEEQEIPNSNFVLRMDRNSFGAQLGLFGDKVQGDFQYPLEKGRVPLIVKLKTNDWNFASLLALFGGAKLADEYTSSLTANVDLRSDAGDIFKTSGKILVTNAYLKRDSLNLQNKGLIEITSDNGNTSIKNFRLEGPNGLLQVRGENFSADNLNVSLNLQSELRLLQIFTPFLEDLGGSINLATTLSGPANKPEVLGSLQSNNAFIKLKGFPHPIEKLSAEAVFSQSKVSLNAIKGQIAGGTLNGDGTLVINGIRDLPCSIRLHLENVAFNVPEKVQTNGNADVVLTGKWFPFVLSGTYHVNNALVEKEFTEDSGQIEGIRQSLYLPKVIRESQFEPILLDLQVLLDKNIVVKNSLIDGSVVGQLQVKGPPTSPLLFGKIYTEKQAKLIFKDKIFEIQNGLIEFNDPKEINPILYISALSRIDAYDITLLAQGASKNPTIRLTSIPPLPEQDIISLIALGLTSSKLDQSLQSKQQAEQLGLEIGGAVIAKPIAKRLESTLGLNLQVTSQFDSTRNINIPKITLSRRLSEKVKVTGSRPVGDTQSYDLKLEYLINNNITAIGSFESKGNEDTATIKSTQPTSQSIFGLDLEFKREFK